MMILNRSRPRSSMKWEEWEKCKGSENLTQQECEGLVRDWSEIPGNRVVHIGQTTKVYAVFDTEEYRIVENGFDIQRLNETISASLAGMRK